MIDFNYQVKEFKIDGSLLFQFLLIISFFPE